MRQRLSLAGALLGDPRVLILDEPANGLDPQGIRWLRELLRSLVSEGRTILSSHVLGEIEQIADEVVIIHRGKFVEHAATAELAARSAGGIRVRSPQVDRLRAVRKKPGSKSGATATCSPASTRPPPRWARWLPRTGSSCTSSSPRSRRSRRRSWS